ncbi:undecaprenyl-diphosphate phosphatase [Sphingomonas sp.]|jgi:undecaprenyl-diphosphatase|uniref:undecaprenyl-diphosphate phosphatase n=1 Tax=Sphingomonas sp. TaxID=28214 RepID=UPI002DE7709F|nr:undecaprenyl-diphosphate phosphatase [Sphingomonas sp.]
MNTEPATTTILLMGILEGFTEFLPVSSTGHLILAGEILGYAGEESKTFKISVQLGAILAVLLLYRERFWAVGTGVLAGNRDALLFTRNILFGTVPALVIGVLAYDAVRSALSSPIIVAPALILGGIAMLLLDRRRGPGRFETVEAIPASAALLVGILQCLAMVPGVSRSGASILGALGIGVERKAAAEFSFFLAVPTMMAATSYDLYRTRELLDSDQLVTILFGCTAAFFTAVVVVRSFVAIVSRFGFAPFAYYRIVAGAVALAWLGSR